MNNPFVRRLACHTPLSPEHRRGLDALTSCTQNLGARETIVRDGDEPPAVNVMLSGWACRHKVLPDGRRQIIALFLPGDICDPYAFLLGSDDQALGTLTPATVAKVPVQALRHLTDSGPGLAEALWWQTWSAVEIQREWTVSIGRRSALERMAHFFCEIWTRLDVVGLASGSECEMPLTQSDMADAMGLSAVHVNRVLQELRASDLIELRAKHLVLHDRGRLMDLAMFDPAYLHVRRP